MKKSLIALIATPLMSLSSMAFAAEPVATEPMQLSAVQMDGVTAGFFNFADIARVTQVNLSPVTVAQISLGNGGALSGNNTALISSGNWAHVHQ